MKTISLGIGSDQEGSRSGGEGFDRNAEGIGGRGMSGRGMGKGWRR